ncbi:MFS transporter [Millisia brevis]|uniref:MFS transporter n=1 Tax=Millisia brevis TaxID=264148 RepID=UPI00082C7CDF|nr:MFS transporter [Millisia brevis]
MADRTSRRPASAAPPLPREILVLIAAAFVIALGYGLVAPILPQFALQFDVGVTAAAAIVSIFAGARLIFAPAAGRAVNLLGERRVYIAGLLIVALFTGACALAQTYWQLMTFRAIAGIGSTMFTVSSLSLVVARSPVAARGRVTGLYATSFLAGSISGPLLGSALSGLGLRAPFVIYAVALVISSLIVAIALRSEPAPGTAAVTDDPARPEVPAWRLPAFRAAVVTNFANGAALFGVRMALIPLFAVEALGRGAGVSGLALTAFAIGNVLVMIPAGRLSDVRGRKPFVIAGLVVSGLATAGLGFSPNVTVFLVLCVLGGVGSGLFASPQQAAVGDLLGGRGRRGGALAGYQMSMDVGTVIGPLLAGWLVAGFGYGVGFAITGAILLLSVLPWLVAPETLPRPPAEAEDEAVADPSAHSPG